MTVFLLIVEEWAASNHHLCYYDRVMVAASWRVCNSKTRKKILADLQNDENSVPNDRDATWHEHITNCQ